MKIQILSYLLLLVFPFSASAQFGYGKISDIEGVQSRKLIVITEQPSDKVIKKLNKKGHADKIPSYQQAIEEYNNNMKLIAEKFWWYSKNGIEYKTFKEVDELRKSKNKDYAVLYCNTAKMSDFHAGFDENSGLNWTWDITDESADRDYWDGFTTMKICLLEDLKDKPISYVVLPDIFPTKASLIFSLNSLQSYMDIRYRDKKENEDVSQSKAMKDMIAKNHAALSQKTLLIRKDFLSKNLDGSKIASAYPYKFKVVTSEELDSIVFNKDAAYVYALIVPAVNSGTRDNDVFYYQAILGADNNEFYAMSKPDIAAASITKSFTFGLVSAGHGKKFIEEKNLHDFIKD